MAYQSNDFFRTKRGAVLGGICAGLSERFQIDVLLIRIAAIVLLVVGRGAGLVYLALWMLLPER